MSAPSPTLVNLLTAVQMALSVEEQNSATAAFHDYCIKNNFKQGGALFKFCKITQDQAFKAIASSCISDLDLSIQPNYRPNIDPFIALLVSSNISKLKLGRSGYTLPFLRIIFEALPQTKITHLELEDLELGTEDIRLLVSQFSFMKLTHLSISRIRLSEEAAELLTNALREMNLVELNLPSTVLKAKALIAIAKTIPNSSLEALQLEGNSFNSDCIRAFCYALPLSRIKALDLSRCNISSIDCCKLFYASYESCITNLNLRNNRIDTRAAQYFALILPKLKLEKLNISGNTITDTGLISIANSLPQSNLSSLTCYSHMHVNAFNSQGYKALLTIIPKSNLEYLQAFAYKYRAPQVTQSSAPKRAISRLFHFIWPHRLFTTKIFSSYPEQIHNAIEKNRERLIFTPYTVLALPYFREKINQICNKNGSQSKDKSPTTDILYAGSILANLPSPIIFKTLSYLTTTNLKTLERMNNIAEKKHVSLGKGFKP